MAETLMQEDQATRAMMFHEVKTYQEKHNENMVKSNPYKTKIAQASLSKSKKWISFYNLSSLTSLFYIELAKNRDIEIIVHLSIGL